MEVHALLGDGAGALRSAEANLIAGRIQALLLEGTPVYDRETWETRPLRLSDIAVLFRARTSLGAYEDALSRAGLPYVVHGGRGLYDRPEVMDAVSLLRAVADPTVDVHLAAVLRGPHVHLTDAQLLAIGDGHVTGECFWDAAQRSQDPAVQEAVTLIRELRKRQPRSARHSCWLKRTAARARCSFTPRCRTARAAWRTCGSSRACCGSGPRKACGTW
ncbi:3'-5' exonuclease [Deinococcus caeni]|uniref:3'-5' exonuclease n=1 Tax=Deinococcus caeni TaxID=569127 RepID=UPI0031EBACDA